jgi:hypothetical protein
MEMGSILRGGNGLDIKGGVGSSLRGSGLEFKFEWARI